MLIRSVFSLDLLLTAFVRSGEAAPAPPKKKKKQVEEEGTLSGATPLTLI